MTNVLLEKKGHIAVATINRPKAFNAFTANTCEELIHAFKVERAEQVRGIPWMAPGMLSLHHLGGFGLSALLAAEHGANHYGFFITPDGGPAIGGVDATSQETIMTSQPGTYDTLPAGVTWTTRWIRSSPPTKRRSWRRSRRRRSAGSWPALVPVGPPYLARRR